MADAEVEMTFKQFVNSIWFRGLSRAAVLLLLPAAGYFLNTQIKSNEAIRALEVNDKVVATALTARNRVVDTAMLRTADDISDMAAEIVTIRESIAAVNGKLSVLVNRTDPAKSVVYLTESIK